MVESKSIKEVLSELGYNQVQRCADEYRFQVLDEKGAHLHAYAINANTGKWFCHVTGRGGDFATFLKIHDKDDINVDLAVAPPVIERPTLFKLSSLDLLFPQFKFYLEKGISEKTLLTFKAGVCHSGKLYNRMTFPIFGLDGRLYGFSGRRLSDNEKAPKWKILGKKDWFVYPAFISEPYIKKQCEVILVESIGDCLALWEAGPRHCLVLFGLNLSGKMLSYLLSLDLKKVYISTNRDETGRGQLAAAKIQKKLCKFFDASKIEVRHPPAPYNDFGEMPRQKILEFCR